MPSTGAYQFVDVSRDQATLVRNPYFREWSHAARPDSYPNRIVFQGGIRWEAGITAVERGAADYMFDGVPPDRIADLLPGEPAVHHSHQQHVVADS